MRSSATLLSAPETTLDGSRWRPRRAWAAAIRVAAAALPVGGGFAVGTLAGFAMRPRAPWPVVAAVATAAAVVAVVGIERAVRHLLPLASLLRLTLVFPDQAPSRYAIARRAVSPWRLKAEMASARRTGDTTSVAERILTLALTLRRHDRRMQGHSERVGVYTEMLADELHVPTDQLDRLRWGALLHDIGKLSVPADILNKPGSLTEEEWVAIRRHPEEGITTAHEIVPWLGPWAAAIGHHHENFDGSGYPIGLAGADTHIAARIVRVADSFETMTTTRAYRQSMSVPAARQELADCSGQQFDPKVVRAFLDLSVGRLVHRVGLVSTAAAVPLIGQPIAWAKAAMSGLPASVVHSVAAVVITGVAATSLLPAGPAAPQPRPLAAAPATTAAPAVRPQDAPPAPVARSVTAALNPTRIPRGSGTVDALPAVVAAPPATIAIPPQPLSRVLARTRLVADPVIASLDGAGLRLYLRFGATLASDGADVSGRLVVFSAGGRDLCSAATDTSGAASCSGVEELLQGLLHLGYEARFEGDTELGPSREAGGLVRFL